MNTDDFEERMRSMEYFHNLRLLPGAWTIIRVDGHGFTRFTGARFQKPFDPAFRDLMTEAALALLEGLHGIYAFTESDEISVLFPPEWDLFDRELEKLVSLSAGIASAVFSKGAGEAAHFDSRICLAATADRVVDYFRWRQSDAARCALNGWCYWTLRDAGHTVAEATRTLERQPVGFKNELLFQHGVNFNDVPLWQRRGIGLYWETYEKEGFNPKENRTVMTTRRRIKVDLELPMKEDYTRMLAGFIESCLKLPPS